MPHTVRDKAKLVNRMKRIIGQGNAIRKALEDERDSTEVMHLVAACRGALGSLLAELVEGHIRHHMVDPRRRPTSQETRAAQQLIAVVKGYVK